MRLRKSYQFIINMGAGITIILLKSLDFLKCTGGFVKSELILKGEPL